jgi:hypothetical protein
MAGQFFFFAGLLGVGGYVGYAVMNHDPAVFPMSKEQAQSTLARAETVMPRKDGDGQIRIWSGGRNSKGVTLNMKYDTDAPLLSCDARIEAIEPDQSRVTVDCDRGSAAGSAIAETTAALQDPMFEEHIQSVLKGREFNRKIVDDKQMAIAMKNMGGMQREALKTADEMQRMRDSQ